jgi:hypothetical protein
MRKAATLLTAITDLPGFKATEFITWLLAVNFHVLQGTLRLDIKLIWI